MHDLWRSHLYRKLLFILFTTSSLLAFDGALGGRFSVTPHFTSGDNFLFEDIFLGADFTMAPGYEKTGLSINIGMGVRPYSKEILVEDGTIWEEGIEYSLYNHYREHRLTFELVAEKDFFVSERTGLYLQGGGMATAAWYRGSSQKADNGFFPIAGAGFAFALGRDFREIPPCTMKIGYRWEDCKTSNPHSISLTFTFLGAV